MVDDDRVAYLLGKLEPQPESPEEILRSRQQILARLIEGGLVSTPENQFNRSLADSRERASRQALRPFAALWPRGSALRWACALAVLAAILAATLTPTGEAVARWIGNVIGIGEPGGLPSLDSRAVPQHRDPDSADVDAEIVNPIVLATGRVSGVLIEITSSHDTSKDLCLSVDLPEISYRITVCPDYSTAGNRSSRPAGNPVVDSFSTAIPGLREGALVAGRAPPGTAAVQLHFTSAAAGHARRRPVSAILADPSPWVRAKARLDRVAVYFAAVVPYKAYRGIAVALDTDGKPVASHLFQANAYRGPLRPRVYAD